MTGAGSSREVIDIETCQDHVQGDGDECPAALAPEVPVCAASVTDSDHLGVTNAGACATFAGSAAGSGDTFLLASLHLSQICEGNAGCGGIDQRGADLIPCTADDTGTRTSVLLPLTTASASTEILDADNTDGSTLVLSVVPTGNPFDAAKVSGGDLSGGQLVGALPALHTVTTGSPFDDSPFSVKLACD
jgi:hypothetical protein